VVVWVTFIKSRLAQHNHSFTTILTATQGNWQTFCTSTHSGQQQAYHLNQHTIPMLACTKRECMLYEKLWLHDKMNSPNMCPPRPVY